MGGSKIARGTFTGGQSNMNAVLVGAVECTGAILEAMVETPLSISAVVTPEPSIGRARHADYLDLAPLCARYGIDCHRIANEAEVAGIVRRSKPDVLFVCGWSRLLSDDAVAAARLGGIGFHPAPLPIGRGRHPLIWTILLGLPEGAVTFFRMTPDADAGEILSQRRFAIARDETARTLMDKVKSEAKAAVSELVSSVVASGSLRGIPQNERDAVVWRKRSSADGRVDFRMTAESIDRLVRALTLPYPGATAVTGDGHMATIWRTEVLPRPEAARWAEPGRVVAEIKGVPIVACGRDAVSLAEHGFDPVPRPGDWFN